MTGHNNKFTKMDCFGGEVQQIHGGEQHAAVLKYDGSLYTWGICDTPGIGYLGREVIGHEFRDEETGLINTKVLKDNLTPKEVQWKGESLPILTMSCGMYHMLLITTQRKLYSVGLNKDGQLGLGDTTNRSEFEMVRFIHQKLVSILLTLCIVYCVAGRYIEKLQYVACRCRILSQCMYRRRWKNIHIRTWGWRKTRSPRIKRSKYHRSLLHQTSSSITTRSRNSCQSLMWG